MPNHVRNIITFDCGEDKLKEILERIQNDEFGIGSIDFNKLIPMPESLNMTSGSIENDTISLYLTSINPDVIYFGNDKPTNEQFFDVYRKLETIDKYKHYNAKLTDDEIKRIYDTYHNFRDEKDYEDVQGFCKSADIEEIRKHGYMLTPGRYVGIEEAEDDGGASRRAQ